MTLIELYMPVFGEAAPRKGEDRENCSDELNQDTTPLLPNAMLSRLRAIKALPRGGMWMIRANSSAVGLNTQLDDNCCERPLRALLWITRLLAGRTEDLGPRSDFEDETENAQPNCAGTPRQKVKQKSNTKADERAGVKPFHVVIQLLFDTKVVSISGV